MTLQRAAPRTSRAASELSLIRRIGQAIAEAADGTDPLAADLLAQSSDEDLDNIGIPVEVLVVDVLGQLGARDDSALVVHQVGQQPVFLRRQPHRLAGEADASGARVEAQVA